ncbi:MAG: pantetheine-phosphate adenylyltransferase [Clostridia bacterium]|nr:pantetheine-phosphate adenylyltransferase [Clostridia bacterium]
MANLRRGLITGSFDPCTKGHENLIKRAVALFDCVDVVIFQNPQKKYLFSLEERLSFLRAVCQKYPTVTVGSSAGMVVDYVKDRGVCAIIKGVRDEKDFLYEKEMAAYNLEHGGAPTLLLPAEKEIEGVSSTLVREALAKGMLPKELLPREILPLVAKTYNLSPK